MDTYAVVLINGETITATCDDIIVEELSPGVSVYQWVVGDGDVVLLVPLEHLRYARRIETVPAPTGD